MGQVGRVCPGIVHFRSQLSWTWTVAPAGPTIVAELQELNDTLEERVAERAHEVWELAAALATAEQEGRRRISELLHDDLQQLLYRIQVTLALAHQKGRGGDTQALLAQTSKSLDLLRDAVDKARRLSVDLSPPVLEGDGLIQALEWLRPHMRDLHGLEVGFGRRTRSRSRVSR